MNKIIRALSLSIPLQNVRTLALYVLILVGQLFVAPCHGMTAPAIHIISHDEIMATFWKYGYDLEGEWNAHVARYMLTDNNPDFKKFLSNAEIIKIGLDHLQAIIERVKNNHLVEVMSTIQSSKNKNVGNINFTAALSYAQMSISNQTHFITPDGSSLVITEQDTEGRRRNKATTQFRPLENAECFIFEKQKSSLWSNKPQLTSELIINYIYTQLSKSFSFDTMCSFEVQNLWKTNPGVAVRIPHAYMLMQNFADYTLLTLRLNEDWVQNNRYTELSWYKDAQNPCPITKIAYEPLVPPPAAAKSSRLFLPFTLAGRLINAGFTGTWWTIQAAGSTTRWCVQNGTQIAILAALIMIWANLEANPEATTEQIKEHFGESAGDVYALVANFTQELIASQKNLTLPQMVIDALGSMKNTSVGTVNSTEFLSALETIRPYIFNLTLSSGQMPPSCADADETNGDAEQSDQGWLAQALNNLNF